MSNQNRVSLFDEWAKTYDHSVQSAKAYPFDGYEALLDRVVELSAPQQGMKILDLGTGTGNLAERFVPFEVSIWGLDFSQEMLEQAGEKMPQGHFGQADLFGEWPQAFEQKYDRIVSGYVFHEFPRAEKIALLRRLAENYLAPDGYFVIGDISFPTAESQDKARALVGDGWDDDEFYWVAEEDVPACEENGFEAQYEQISSCGGIYLFRPSAG